MTRKKKKSTRRSVSIRGLVHQRLMSYCAQEGRSLSGLVEQLSTAYLDRQGQPGENILRDRVWTSPKSGPKPEITKKIGGVITF